MPTFSATSDVIGRRVGQAANAVGAEIPARHGSPSVFQPAPGPSGRPLDAAAMTLLAVPVTVLSCPVGLASNPISKDYTNRALTGAGNDVLHSFRGLAALALGSPSPGWGGVRGGVKTRVQRIMSAADSRLRAPLPQRFPLGLPPPPSPPHKGEGRRLRHRGATRRVRACRVTSRRAEEADGFVAFGRHSRGGGNPVPMTVRIGIDVARPWTSGSCRCERTLADRWTGSPPARV